MLTDGLGRPDVFDGRPLTLLLDGAPRRLRLQAEAPADFAIEVEVAAGLDEALVPSAAAVFARRRILALQDRLALRPFESEAVEPEIEALSLRHGVLSRRTAWVAVERRRTVEDELVVVEQPAELPAGWAGDFDPAITGAFDVSMKTSAGSRMPTGGVYRRMAAPPSAPMAPAPQAPMASAPPPRRARKPGLFERAMEVVAAPFERKRESSRQVEMQDFFEESISCGGVISDEVDVGKALSLQIAVDGSFAGGGGQPSVLATAIALALLLEAGSSRRRGLRRRVVGKAAAWLRTQLDAAGGAAGHLVLAQRVLDALDAADVEPAGPGLPSDLERALRDARAADPEASGRPGKLWVERFGR